MPTPAQDKGPVKFKTRTAYVLVPVVVKDKNRRHIPGLTKDDFTVRENGKVQRLVAVDEYKADSRPILRPKVMATEATNQLDVEGSHKNLTIIAFDLINTSFPDQATARQSMVDLIKNAKANGSLFEVLLFTRRGVRLIHDFSTDADSLARTVQGMQGETPGEKTTDQGRQEVLNMSTSQAGYYFVHRGGIADLDQYFRSLYSEDVRQQQVDAVTDTLAALEYVAGTMAGIPGRKSLLWVTGSFPFTLDENNLGIGVGTLGQIDNSTLHPYLPSGQTSALYERTMQMLNNSNVAIYPVDARGLVYAGLQDASVASTSNNTTKAAQFDYLSSVGRQLSSTLSTMKQVAEMTGGKAYFNTNDIEHSLQEASSDAASYYMLTYKLESRDQRSGWRNIDVKVSRNGAQVRARKGYFLTNDSQDPAITKKMDMYWALHSPLDFTALPTTVRWTGVRDSGGKRMVTFEIELGADSVTIDDSDPRKIYVDFAAVTKNAKGEYVAEASRSYTIRLKQEAVDQIRTWGITYRNAMEVPDGQYEVTFVVRDNLSGRLGSVVVPLDTMGLVSALEPGLATRPRP